MKGHKAISQPSEYCPPRIIFFLVGCIDIEWQTVEAVCHAAVRQEGELQGL